MGSNTEEKPWTNLQSSYKNLNKEIKNDNFCYRKVTKIISYFGGTNAIFADCTYSFCLLVFFSYSLSLGMFCTNMTTIGVIIC